MVTIITGTLDYGQGHASPFAQVLSTRLGIPFQRIRLVQGDSDELIAGGGTGGSKSMMTSGTAIVAAGDKVVENGKQIAAHVLEAAVADIEFRAGRMRLSMTSALSSTRFWSMGRRMAASSRVSVRRCASTRFMTNRASC
jgi:carbon-monoxide dehydrogenase large subunit